MAVLYDLLQYCVTITATRHEPTYCPHFCRQQSETSMAVTTAKAVTAKLTVWNPEQWQVPEQGPALVELFSRLGYDSTIPSMIEAFGADPSVNLDMMIRATGNSEPSSDISYIITEAGRVALEVVGDCHLRGSELFVGYDKGLRAPVADLEEMHREMLAGLQEELQAATEAGTDADAIKEEVQEFAVENICNMGGWIHGIALKPFPKFFLVTKFIKKHFLEYYDSARKMWFFKQPDTKAPPFLQIKLHKTCIRFKDPNEPGRAIVNPEFSKAGRNELRDDLPDEVYDKWQFTVEIIGGKTTAFPDGLSGKISCVDGTLVVIPMAPPGTKLFDPHGEDNSQNSYSVFKRSHPCTCVRNHAYVQCELQATASML